MYLLRWVKGGEGKENCGLQVGLGRVCVCVFI
jgi:hypothetical protein